MSHKDTLYAWLKANRPDVFALVDVDRCDDLTALPILNKASGLADTGNEVVSSDRVEDGCKRFLAAFQAAKVCATCNGTGRVLWSGEDSSAICPDCGGSTPKR